MDLKACLHDLTESQLHWFNMNCTNDFCIETWKSLNLVRGVLSIFGLLVVLTILFFLVYYKAYSSLFQRLYLYLIIATLLNEIVGITSMEHQWYYPGQKTVCVWVGFFTGWTYVLLFIFSYEIIAYNLFLVVSKIRGIQFHDPCGVGCTRRCCALTAEIVLIVLPIFISTAFALPPYKQKMYGIAGPWCFVRSLNYNCTATGGTFQMTFFGMYMALGVVGIIASIAFSIVYFKLSSSFKEVRYLLKRTLYVLVFKFVHIFMIMCSTACRIYTLVTHTHEQYGLWMLFALAVPLGVLVFPLGYLLCFHPLGNIAQIIYQKLIHICCNREMMLNQNGDKSTTLHSTAPKSNRISQPSYTFFFASHSDDLSERSRLISDTGDGST